MSRSPLTLADYRALSEIRYQIRAFLSFSERAARSFGIEPQQHQLLLACKGLPAGRRPTIGTLAQRLCVEHHTAVALVDKLVAADYVRRVPSTQDRREVLVEITERGETVLAALSELHHDQLQGVGSSLIEALSGVLSEHALHRAPPDRRT